MYGKDLHLKLHTRCVEQHGRAIRQTIDPGYELSQKTSKDARTKELKEEGKGETRNHRKIDHLGAAI